MENICSSENNNIEFNAWIGIMINCFCLQTRLNIKGIWLILFFSSYCLFGEKGTFNLFMDTCVTAGFYYSTGECSTGLIPCSLAVNLLHFNPFLSSSSLSFYPCFCGGSSLWPHVPLLQCLACEMKSRSTTNRAEWSLWGSQRRLQGNTRLTRLNGSLWELRQKRKKHR